MPAEDPTEFNDREKFIIAYYRSSDSDARRFSIYDVAIAAASLFCIVLFFAGGEQAWGFVGYALVLSRLIYLVIEGGRWSRDCRSIFRKYDAELKASSEHPKKEPGQT